MLKLLDILHVQVAGINQRSGKDDFINFPCIFAEHSPYHRNRTDEKPSAGISTSDKEESMYHCYTCDNSGNLSYLIWKLNDETKSQTTQEALEWVREHESSNSYVNMVSSMNDMDLIDKTLELLNDFEFPDVNLYSENGNATAFDTSNYSTGNIVALELMLRRGYSVSDTKKVLNKLHLLEKRDSLFYLQIDFLGKNVGVQKIKLGENNQPKYKIFYNSHFYLLNEQCLQGVSYKGVDISLVEGIFDVARLLTKDSFKHVLGSPGKLGIHQIDKVLYFAKRVFMFADCDPTGYMNVKKIYEASLIKRPDLMIFVFNMFVNEKEDVDSYFSKISIHSFDFRAKDVFVTAKRYLEERHHLFIEEKPIVKVVPVNKSEIEVVKDIEPIEEVSAKVGLFGEFEA